MTDIHMMAGQTQGQPTGNKHDIKYIGIRIYITLRKIIQHWPIYLQNLKPLGAIVYCILAIINNFQAVILQYLLIFE